MSESGRVGMLCVEYCQFFSSKKLDMTRKDTQMPEDIDESEDEETSNAASDSTTSVVKKNKKKQGRVLNKKTGAATNAETRLFDGTVNTDTTHSLPRQYSLISSRDVSQHTQNNNEPSSSNEIHQNACII